MANRFSDLDSKRKPAVAVAETAQERRTDSGAGQGVKSTTAPSRRGKVAMQVHVPPEVRRQLKSLAVSEDRTIHQLVGEALNFLFESRGQTVHPSLTERD